MQPKSAIQNANCLIDFDKNKPFKPVGDQDKLSFRKNILENYAGYELEEMDEKQTPHTPENNKPSDTKGYPSTLISNSASMMHSRNNSRPVTIVAQVGEERARQANSGVTFTEQNLISARVAEAEARLPQPPANPQRQGIDDPSRSLRDLQGSCS